MWFIMPVLAAVILAVFFTLVFSPPGWAAGMFVLLSAQIAGISWTLNERS